MTSVHPKFLELDNNERINALHQAIEDLAAGRRLADVFEAPEATAPPVQALSLLSDACHNLDRRVQTLENALVTICDRLESIPGLGVN